MTTLFTGPTTERTWHPLPGETQRSPGTSSLKLNQNREALELVHLLEQTPWLTHTFLAPQPLLIRAWRALQLLDRLGEFEEGMLQACWQAVDPQAAVFTGFPERFSLALLRELRQEICLVAPSPEQLDSMLHRLCRYGFEVNQEELAVEIKRGTLTETPLIRDFLQDPTAAQRAACERELEVTSPVPPDQSLGAFFAVYRVDNIIDGLPGSTYGQDWGYVTGAALDDHVRRGRLLHRRPTVLQRTSEPPSSPLTGEVGAITFINYRTRLGFTFLSADYDPESGGFVVDVRSQRLREEPSVHSCTLSELRELLGPPPRTPRERMKLLWNRLVRR